MIKNLLANLNEIVQSHLCIFVQSAYAPLTVKKLVATLFDLTYTFSYNGPDKIYLSIRSNLPVKQTFPKTLLWIPMIRK